MTSPPSYQPSPKLPIEFRLAVACCRWSFSGEGADDVGRLAAQAGWTALVATCRRHRVQGLVWHALCELEGGLPAPVQIALASDARAIADQGLRAARESARLLHGSRAAGIPMLFLKGLTLGKLAYGNPFLKMGWDIDLLVLPADIAAAASVLGNLGYRLAMPGKMSSLQGWHAARKESVWRNAGVFVELHSRVADQPDLIPAITASSPSRAVAVAPGIELPTLADDELFAYLCVHGASSAWFRLKWVTDLAALLHRRGREEIEALYERSQRLGADRAAAQALLLASQLYAIPLSERLADRLGTPVNRWLARAALQDMLRGEPTERPFGTRTIHLTQFFLKPGLGYKLRELDRQFRTAVGLF